VFADRDPFFEASLEAVAGKQADAFLIYANAKEATDALDGTHEEQFLFTTFPNTKASKDHRVIVTDYTFTAPGWRLAQTVEDFAHQLHPKAFP
jgi:ABC-type Fe3+-hydroxamate transport system substrate-binding protein